MSLRILAKYVIGVAAFLLASREVLLIARSWGASPGLALLFCLILGVGMVWADSRR